MCYKCHGISTESTKKGLQEIINYDYKQFDQWNTTSVHHVLISMTGHDGDECQILSIKVLEKFIKWYQDNRN